MRVDGSVWCWGGDGFGQLGDGASTNRSEPAAVAGVRADEIVSGNLHVCARTGDRVACWGANTRGQLGDGTTIDRSSPVEVSW
jgi:alpha-tubulin suppressor-like RCC1 family protein